MKKLLSVLLALLMAFSLPLTVYAGTYTIRDENGEIINEIEVSDEAPSELTALKTSDSWVKLSWSFNDWNVYIDGFEVLRYYPKSQTTKHIAYTSKYEYKVKELKASTSYYYVVRSFVLYDNIRYFGAQSQPFGVSTAPKAAKLKKVKYAGTGSLKVTLKKVKKISGYQLQYSTSKKFKDGFTNNLFISKKKTSYTIKNLQNKTYYVRLRTYRNVDGVKFFGAWSAAKSATVKKGVSLKKMINAYKTDLSGRKAIKELTEGGVDIKKYKTTYDRIRAIYKWHAVHGLEFEHCLACNSNFNDCLLELFGKTRAYDAFIWIDAGNFINRSGSPSIHKWSVLYFAGVPYIFDPRLQSYTKDYDGTMYFGVEKGSALRKRYDHEEWWGYWSNFYSLGEQWVPYHK